MTARQFRASKFDIRHNTVIASRIGAWKEAT
jgi:hypothetical protein